MPGAEPGQDLIVRSRRDAQFAAAVQLSIPSADRTHTASVCDGFSQYVEKQSFRLRQQPLAHRWHLPTLFDGSKFAAPRTAPRIRTRSRYSPPKGKSRGKRRKANGTATPPTPPMAMTVLASARQCLAGWDACYLALSASSGNPSDKTQPKCLQLPRPLVGDYGKRYPFWSTELASWSAWGSNVTFLNNWKKTLYIMPESVQRNGQPPLMLRLIQVKTARSPMWLLTNDRSHRATNSRDLLFSVGHRVLSHGITVAEQNCNAVHPATFALLTRCPGSGRLYSWQKRR